MKAKSLELRFVFTYTKDEAKGSLGFYRDGKRCSLATHESAGLLKLAEKHLWDMLIKK